MQRLIVIGGPTASGKTALAVKLADATGSEIISADSRQCYREMSIGTAKPSNEELSKIKHHFINNHSLPETINAGLFATEMKPVLTELFKKNNMAIICGGSGLYIKSLLEGLDEFPDIPDEIRTAVRNEMKVNGIKALQRELAVSDPEWFAVVDKNNPRRLQRAIEVIRTSGKKYSSFLNKPVQQWPFSISYYSLNPDRDLLYDQIGKRVQHMIDNGLEDEVRSLLPWRSHPALATVGYREFFDHFDGKLTLKETIESIAMHTRNYAKRQWTWFKNQGSYTALSGSDQDALIKAVTG